MIITLTVQTTGHKKFDICVGNVQELIELIIVLENSTSVKAFKIAVPEGILITNLYNSYHLGNIEKFVTKFNWEENFEQT